MDYMISVLASISQKECEQICKGKQTAIIMKTKPKTDVPVKVYIYCTKGKLALLRDDDSEDRYKYDTWKFLGFHQLSGKKLLSGRVIGEFVCNKFTYIGNISSDPWNRLSGSTHEYHKKIVNNELCLTEEELHKYGGKYVWHISDFKLYNNPEKLENFEIAWRDPYSNFYDIRPCENGKHCEYAYFEYSEDVAACSLDFSGNNCYYTKVRRAPQTWLYVEDRGNIHEHAFEYV